MHVLSIIFLLACIAKAIVIEGSTQEIVEHTKANFGLDYGNTSRILFFLLDIAITGELAIANPFNACNPLMVNMTGKIGIAIRDQSNKSCSFVDKILHV